MNALAQRAKFQTKQNLNLCDATCKWNLSPNV